MWQNYDNILIYARKTILFLSLKWKFRTFAEKNKVYMQTSIDQTKWYDRICAHSNFAESKRLLRFL